MSLRLRLCIQRYSTPEVNSLWVVDLTDDLTVAKLLGQINHVFTLESGEWGLEDYVVQVAGPSASEGSSQRWYECLHFQKVAKLFKDMDQVLIRSLLTDDLRQRRLSGRHQISADGRHLVDGLAFGRPWLRPPRDRPLVELPPRKRAKLLQGQEEYDREPEQLLLEGTDAVERGIDSEGDDEYVPAGVDSQASVHEESDDDDDDDFEELAEDSEDDLDAELALLRADNAIVQDDALSEAGPEHGLLSPQALSDDEFSGFPDSSPAKPHPQTQEDVFDRTTKLSLEEKVELLRKAWPYHPTGSIRGALAASRESVRHAYNVLLQTGEAECAYADLVFEALTMNMPPSLRQNAVPTSTLALHNNAVADGEQENSVFTGFNPATAHPPRPLIQEVEIYEDPVTSTADRSGGSTIHNAVEEGSDETSSSDSGSDSDDDDFLTSQEDSSVDDSSDSETTDSENQAFEDAVPAVSVAEAEESDSSSDDSSDLSSSKDSREGINLQQVDQVAQDVDSDGDSDDSSSVSSESSSGSDSDSISSSPEEISSKPLAKPVSSQPLVESVPSQKKVATSLQPAEHTVAPGKGLKQTQKRNLRRRKLKQIKKESARQEAITAMEEKGDGSETSLAQQLLARKQALLAAVLNDGQEETTTTEQPTSYSTAIEAPQQANNSKPDNMTDADDADTAHVSGQQRAAVTTASVVDSQPSPTTDSSQKKSRFDLGAGRRMLFGALGLKTPKTKVDEDKLKAKLMEDVRPLKNHRIETETSAVSASDDASRVEDFDSWKDKINYRAVECCHDGMTLSEPPFPFVQRWDPQQKFSSMRKRKRQSQEYYYDDYSYEDDNDDSQDWYGDEEAVTEPAPKRKKGKNKKKHVNDEPETLNYDDVPDQTATTKGQVPDTDDLPSLPKDVATLPSLQLGQVKPGMVITWKQLQMNKSTNWQPQQTSITALVLSGVDNDTNMLHVILAKRDRERDEPEYDYNTGKRVYDKFEMPQDEDEEGQEDDGHRDVDWIDLMDVRLVQIEPLPSTFASPDKGRRATSDVIPSIEKEHSPSGAHPTQGAILHNQAHGPAPSTSGLDTQTVITAMPPDPAHAAASTESTSIQSGQHVPPDVQVSVDYLTSYSTDNGEPKDFGEPCADNAKIQEKETFEDVPGSDGSNSPTRQLDGDSQIYLAAGSSLSTPRIEDRSAERPQVSPLEPLPQDDDALVVFDDEPELSRVDYDLANGSLSPAVPRVSPAVAYHGITIPSSVASPGSGRQQGGGIVSTVSHGLDTNVESVVPETVPVPHENLPAHLEPKNIPVSQASSRRLSPMKETPKLKSLARNFPDSSSPLASLEEVFHTAVTSRLTQSPSRSTQQSVLASCRPSSKPNLEYEEAMRRLDEGEDSDFSPDRNRSIRGLFPNATQPVPETSSARLDVDDSLLGFDSNDLDGFEIRDSTSSPSRTRSQKRVSSTSKERTSAPAAATRKRAVKKEEKLVIPEGSQILSIDSSPPPSESYADDDIDGDWGDENGIGRTVRPRKAGTGSGKAKASGRRASSSLPKGPGWAKKTSSQSTTARGDGGSSQARRSTRRSSSRV